MTPTASPRRFRADGVVGLGSRVPNVSRKLPKHAWVVGEGITHKQEMTAGVHAGATVEGGLTIERGLNDLRVAVLGILVRVGLAAAAIPDAWWTQLVAGSAASRSLGSSSAGGGAATTS